MNEQTGFRGWWNKIRGKSEDDDETTQDSSPSQTPPKSRRLVRPVVEFLAGEIDTGLRDAMRGFGIPVVDERTQRGSGNPVAAFIGKQARQLGSEIKTGVKEELRGKIAASVREGVTDGVRVIKKDFNETLRAVNDRLLPEKPDSRTTYGKMKDLLGYKKEDGIFSKVIKIAGAKILSWGVPVLSFISGKLASTFTGERGPDEEKRYRNLFNSIYTQSLSIIAPRPATPQAPGA